MYESEVALAMVTELRRLGPQYLYLVALVRRLSACEVFDINTKCWTKIANMNKIRGKFLSARES